MHNFKKTELTEKFLTRWSDDEDNQLIMEINNCLSKKEIALIHKRTEGSIRCRILKLAYSDHLNKIPIEKISIKFNISIHDLNKYIAKKENKHETINKINIKTKISFDDVFINNKSNNKLTTKIINVNDESMEKIIMT
jgi:hypothetical protein